MLQIRLFAVEGTEADVKRRIGIARGIFQMLSKIWTERDLSKALKIEVFEVMVISALLYNSETWVIKACLLYTSPSPRD